MNAVAMSGASDGPGDMAKLDAEAAAMSVPRLPHTERVRIAAQIAAGAGRIGIIADHLEAAAGRRGGWARTEDEKATARRYAKDAAALAAEAAWLILEAVECGKSVE